MTILEMFNRLTFGRTLILGFVFTAVYYFFVFDSGENQVNSIHASETQLVTIQKDIANIQTKLDQAYQFRNASATLGKSINRLLDVIPSGFRIGDFMKTTSTEARYSGLQITKMAPTMNLDANSVPEFSELGVSIELRGQFSQILKFMATLTKKKQIFIYRYLRLAPDKSSAAGNGLVLMTADIRAFNYIGQLNGEKGAAGGKN